MPRDSKNKPADENVEKVDKTVEVGGVAGKRLLAFIERIERLDEEKKGLAEDIKDIFAESKGVGFDVKIIRRILKLRKADAQKVREEKELEGLYLSALGMQQFLDV